MAAHLTIASAAGQAYAECVLPGDKELERLARDSFREGSPRKPSLEREVFVWVDLAGESAINFAAVCHAAEAGDSTLASDALEDPNAARTYWVPEGTARRLTNIPPGNPDVIRIVAYDGKRGTFHWCTVAP